MTLFDIQGEYLRLYELATETDDADSIEAFNNALDDLNTDLANKASGYVHVIKQLEMEAEECDKVIEAFRAKKSARKNNAKRLKDAILAAMDVANLKEIKAGAYTVKIANNGGKVPMTVNEGAVPENYMRIKYEPDTELIRKALEEGKELPFACLEERGRHLNIK